nr:unnamed protein product [Callosobruchus analis]
MHLDKGELSSYSICSVNIQGLNSKKDDLLIFLNDERFDVICICEHWLSKNTLPSVNLYPYELITSYCRENIVHGGVAIYSLSKIRTKPIDLTKYCQPLHAEFCGVELFNRNTFLLSLYRSSASGNIHIFINKLTDILHFLYNRYKYIIIVGDINLDLDKAQENLPDMTNLLTSFGLQYYINEPTRITNRSSSCLDNIITNISSTLVSAGVIKSDMSDHCPVFVTIDYYLTKPGNDADVQIVRAINDKRICKFVQKLRDTNWDFIHTRTSSEETTDTLIKTLSNCVNCCFPLIKKPVRHNQVAWFTNRLKEMRSEVSEKRLRYNTTKSDSDWCDYSSRRADYRRAIKEEKKANYSAKIMTANNRTKMSWNIINSKRKGQVGEALRERQEAEARGEVGRRKRERREEEARQSDTKERQEGEARSDRKEGEARGRGKRKRHRGEARGKGKKERQKGKVDEDEEREARARSRERQERKMHEGDAERERERREGEAKGRCKNKTRWRGKRERDKR